MKVLPSLLPSDANTYIRIIQLWEQLLFEWGFPGWLIDHADGEAFKWTTIIRNLYDGSVVAGHGPGSVVVPDAVKKPMLTKLTAIAMVESPAPDRLYAGFTRLSFRGN